MRNNTEIQIIGYVYQDARCPNERDYPNWVTFKMSVNKKYKDKNGQEQQDTTWFECKSNSEKMSKNIKEYVKDKMGLMVKGVPKAKAYMSNSGTAEASIEVLVTDFNILTYPKEAEANKTTYGNETLNKGAEAQDGVESGKYKINYTDAVANQKPAEVYNDEVPF